MLGGRISQVNGQDQIAQSGNYGYSSIWVTSIDEKKTKKTAMTDSYPMSKLHHSLRR